MTAARLSGKSKVVLLLGIGASLLLPGSARAHAAGGAAQSATSEQAATPPRESKSGSDDPQVMGGANTVGEQLVQDDKRKNAVFDVNFTPDGLYAIKRRLKDNHGIEANIDYNFLNQYANHSTTDRQASSGSLRIYGQWSPASDGRPRRRAVVFRFETRHEVGSGIPPRDLGFDAGSALSTASFKAFGWGVTSLYWEQAFAQDRFAFVAGQMDPGDFEDLHPLLNAWTYFMNDASFNNPTTALPQQGLGIIGRLLLTGHRFYVTGGIHDANGSPTAIDFQSFFQVREYFTWIEAGWAPNPTRIRTGEGAHVTLWHADERVEAGVPESWGVAFSAANRAGRWLPFVRAGYSPQDDSPGVAILLSAMVSAGLGVDIRGDDMLGIAVTWGRPPQTTARDQVSWEALYRWQLTQNIQLTPGIQWTFNPSATLEVDQVRVGSIIRARYAF